MLTEIGVVEAIYRYPVKSMAGEQLQEAELGWHGIGGDRRFALRRMEDHSGFPWLTASKLPELLLYTPVRLDSATELPTHVRTPDGRQFPIFGSELAADVGEHYGSPVQMMQIRHGVFDDASVSLIASATVEKIGQLACVGADARRFRPNVVVRLRDGSAFGEDKWVGGVLSFGERADGPSVSVTMHDVRCAMVNLDPDTAKPTPEVLKAVVRANGNNAGVYGTVVGTGVLKVGQTIYFRT